MILLVFIGAQSAQDIVALMTANKGGGSSLSGYLSAIKKPSNQPASDPMLPDDPTIATSPPPEEEEEGA